MTIQINLGVAVLDPSQRATLDLATFLAREIAKPFAVASGQDIQLRPYVHQQPWQANYSGPIDDSPLHDALEEVTGRQQRRNKVTNIGLLLGDRYQSAPTYFGFMFDGAFRPDDGDRGSLTPREGCAVFLGAIGAKRAGAAFREEVLYTAVHEVGHVFNLQHSGVPSYMATSAANREPFDLNQTKFNALEQRQLSRCSVDPHVWPGGSAFEDLGTLARANSPRSNPRKEPEPVRMRIALSKQEFWSFEPVELDVELVRHGKANHESVNVPAAVDPGHAAFTIWIEEPDGSRRRYRAPNRFCGATSKIALSKSAGYRRDISIFGESGAYTFRRAGVHRVWATFKINSALTIRSNMVECDVLPVMARDNFYSRAHPLFSDAQLSTLLYYRQLNTRRIRKLNRLREFCDHFPNHASVAMARYAMGRALAAHAQQKRRSGLPYSEAARRAVDQLRLSIDHQLLGDHRVGLAEGALESLARISASGSRGLFHRSAGSEV